MNKAFRNTFFLFFILCGVSGNAQNPRLDSLIKVVSALKDDTLKVLKLSDVAREFIIVDSAKFFLYADKVKVLADKLNYVTGKISYLGLYSNYYFETGNYSLALDGNFKALKLLESSNNKKGMVRTLRNIGSIYTVMRNNDNALKYYNEALTLANEINYNKEVGATYANMAIIYHKNKDYVKAMDYNMKALKIAEELKDVKTIGYVYNSLGKLFYDRGLRDENRDDLDKAIEYLGRSLKIKEEIGDKRGMANTLGNMAEVYSDKGELEKSLEVFKQGMVYADETNYSNWKLEGYERISTLYEKLNDYKSANDYFHKFIALRDTLEGVEMQKEIAELQGKYNTEKKDKEILQFSKDNELNQTRLSRQNYVIGAVVLGLMVVLTFAFFIYRGYKEKQKINHIIEEKNKSITDSIRYAKRIQNAILPSDVLIQKLLADIFVFYKPKDIVSGDFYFCAQAGDKIILAVADCTGHGVPGAFMSMIGNSLLNQIIKENKISTPSEILNNLNVGVREALGQHESDSDTRDGMDIALCAIDLKKGSLEFAGANRSIYIVKKSKVLEEYKANKFPIGGIQSEEAKEFTNQNIDFAKGDMLYLSSDGYADQFGGSEGKKFRTRQLKELIASVSQVAMVEQKTTLEDTFIRWMGNAEQIDDVLVIGVRL